MSISIQNEIKWLFDMKLLDMILLDKTSKGKIIWATDIYSCFGEEYKHDREITPNSLIQGSFQISIRAEKEVNEQEKRSKTHAEVFTPLNTVKKMVDYLDKDWFGHEGVFDDPDNPVIFSEKSWKEYIDSRRMEITCGEAPFLVSRYDVVTGEEVPIPFRVGILDRKLRVVSENACTEKEWIKWTYRAFQATYGYELQGDNVLLSRLNLLLTFKDYMKDKLNREPTLKEYQKLIRIITWNIWQMDGLTETIPFCKASEEYEQLSLFDLNSFDKMEEKVKLPCRIFDWRANCSLEYRKLKRKSNYEI